MKKNIFNTLLRRFFVICLILNIVFCTSAEAYASTYSSEVINDEETVIEAGATADVDEDSTIADTDDESDAEEIADEEDDEAEEGSSDTEEGSIDEQETSDEEIDDVYPESEGEDEEDTELIEDEEISSEEEILTEDTVSEENDNAALYTQGFFQRNTNKYTDANGGAATEICNVISVWGNRCQYVIPDKKVKNNINGSIAQVENNGSQIVVTGGSTSGRLDFKTTTGDKYIVYNYSSKEEFEYLYELFHDKKIGVLGDSISTLENNIPPGRIAYNFLKDVPYNNMYWADIITRFGAKRGCIEALCGSCIGSKFYPMYDWNRINTIAKSGGVDILFFFGGTNQDVSLKPFDREADISKIVLDKGTFKDTATAYSACLNRLRYKCPDTLIIQILPFYNAAYDRAERIKEMADYYNIASVDLRQLNAKTPIKRNDIIHPSRDGQLQISNFVCEQVYLAKDMVEKELRPENRTITFDATTNGGQCDTQKMVIPSDNNSVVAKKTECIFKGWYTKPVGGTLVTDFNKVGFSTTLYAQFEVCNHFYNELRNEKRAGFNNPGYTGDVFCYTCGYQIFSGSVIAAYSTKITGCEGSAVADVVLPEGWEWKDSVENMLFPSVGKTLNLNVVYTGEDRDKYSEAENAAVITLTSQSHKYEQYSNVEQHKCINCGMTEAHKYVSGFCQTCSQEDCRITKNHTFGDNAVCKICKTKCSHMVNPESPIEERVWSVTDGVCTICHTQISVPVDNNNKPIVGEIPEELWVNGIADQTYTGSAITQPEMTVYWYYKKLTVDKDYTVRYTNNVKAGTATVTIKGKGNYTGTIVKQFIINPVDISSAKAFDEDITIAANSKVQKPTTTFTIDVNGKTVQLKSGTDFVYEYPEIKEPGNYTVKITGRGNYCNSKDIQVHVVNDKIPVTALSVGKIPNQEYTGSAIEPEITVTYNRVPLEKGKDYLVSYSGQKAAGVATLSITGIGAYTGTRNVSFNIVGTPIKRASVANVANVPYNGSAIEPGNYVLTIRETQKTLELNKDYTISYSNNTNVGVANVIFTGINGYTGTLKKPFRITKVSMADESRISIDPVAAVEYQKNGAKPPLTVKDGSRVLNEGVDYTVRYSNNNGVKEATAIVIGKGNYEGKSKPVHFQVLPSSLSNVTATAKDIVAQNKSNICKPVITLTDANGAVLKAGIDYDKKIEYRYKYFTKGVKRSTKQGLVDNVHIAGSLVNSADIIPAGTELEAIVTGIGAYKDSLTVPFRYVRNDISKTKVVIPNMKYTGQEITLSDYDMQVTFKSGDSVETLVLDRDYKITGYKNNLNKGTAKVTIEGLGNYGGTKEISFKIVAKTINYTIVFDKNSSDAAGIMNSVSVPAGTKIPLNKYKLDGKTFKCWCTKPDENDIFAQTYTNGEAFAKKGFSILSFGDTITLYAIWE